MRIDNVFVVTYQGAWSVLNRIEELGIGYAIMDEVHYFISDSLFADNTWELLTKMVRKLKDTVRIYLSATGWDVFDLIDSEELELVKARSVDYGIPNCIIPEYNCYQLLAKKYYARSGELTLYSFPQRERDISLIVLPCTVRDKSIVDLIEKIKAAPPREKWVVFVVSKEKGLELCEKLQRELGGKEFVSYVDAETKASETWKKLVMESRFDARVLVSTSVADCGMNIHDSDVKHIVLFTTDRTQFIQELGRKRLEEGEHINVYVPDLSLQQLARLENHNRQYLNLIREYRASEENAAKLNTLRQRLWRKGDAQQRHIVDVEWYTGKLCINRCAEEQVERRRVYHEDLRRDFDSGVKSPFLVNVAKWLDVPIPDFEGVLDEEEKRERAKALLQSYLGKKLDGQTKEKFVDEVGRQFTEWFGPRDGANASRDKNLGIKYPSMNKWINELKLGFTLDGGKGDDTPWYLLLAEE